MALMANFFTPLECIGAHSTKLTVNGVENRKPLVSNCNKTDSLYWIPWRFLLLEKSTPLGG